MMIIIQKICVTQGHSSDVLRVLSLQHHRRYESAVGSIQYQSRSATGGPSCDFAIHHRAGDGSGRQRRGHQH